MTGREVRTLLALLVLMAAFVAYELAGLDPNLPGIHTISFIAQQSPGLRIGIGAAFIAGGLVGLAWWIHHLRGRIPK